MGLSRLRPLARQVSELLALARSVSRLGADRSARLQILALGLALPVKRRLASVRSREVTLRLRALGRDLGFTVVDRADFVILDEVLVAGAYEIPEVTEPRTILDLGANVGASVAFFRLRYPEAAIYACEPSPAVFGRLERNVGGLGDVNLRRTAVADHSGSLAFRISDESLMSSLDPRTPGREVTVEAKTLDDLLSELDVSELDLLKIDVEGAEYGVLSSSSALQRTRAVVGEVHLDLMPQSSEEFFALFSGFEVRKRRMELPDIPRADRWTFLAIRPPGEAERAGRG